MIGERGEKGGLVKDLAEKVRRGEITQEEAKREVLKMGLHHAPYEYKYKLIMTPLMIVGALLCTLPFLARLTGFELLAFLAQMPSITLPNIVKIAMGALFAISMAAGTYATYLRTKKGGTRSEDEPIIHLREGPYAIMRHPTDFGLFGLIMLFFTIVASDYVPFTALSVVGNILWILGTYYVTVGEEELNVLKWGDEYRRYQKEVPRFDFILGMLRWANRKRKQK